MRWDLINISPSNISRKVPESKEATLPVCPYLEMNDYWVLRHKHGPSSGLKNNNKALITLGRKKEMSEL